MKRGFFIKVGDLCLLKYNECRLLLILSLILLGRRSHKESFMEREKQALEEASQLRESQAKSRDSALTWLRYLLQVGIIFTVYFFTAKGGLQLDAVSGFATLVWPPTGIALAALFIFGYRFWPGIALAAFLVNYLTGAPFLAALAIGTGNTLEALIGVWLIKKFDFDQNTFERVKSVILFICFGVLLNTIISATIGTGSLFLTGVITLQTFTSTFLAWWVGDMLGALIIGGFLLNLKYGSPIDKSIPRLIEGIVLFSLLILFNFFLFIGLFHMDTVSQDSATLIYLIFPLLIWAALRFGTLGASAAMLLVSIISAWGTVLGGGPFVSGTLSDNLLSLQLFIGTSAVTVMVLAAAVAERIAAEKTLGRMAFHDSLTGLPNRKALQERLNVALTIAKRNERKAALIFLDLDKFKSINDTFGHHIGDMALRKVAERLREAIREEDTVARLGGDEFIIMLSEVSSAADASNVAEKVLTALESPIVFGTDTLLVTASMGITLYPEDGTDALTLLRKADGAVYKAKDAGRNRYEFHSQTLRYNDNI